MSNPGVLGRTDLYLSYGLTFDGGRPIRVQGGVGSCQECTIGYGMEMLAMLTRQPVIALSQLYLFYVQQPTGDPMRAAMSGVCAESLWPFWLVDGPDTWTTGVSDYNQQQKALATQPYPDAYKDAPNHRLLEYDTSVYTGVVSDRKAKAIAALKAGYVLSCFLPPNHQVCVWDYIDKGPDSPGTGIGFDSRSKYVIPGMWDFDFCVPMWMMKRVAFTGATPPVFVPPAWSFPPPTQPKVSPMINVSASLSGANTPTGTITVTATYPGDANNAAVTTTSVFNPDGTPAVAPPAVTLIVGGSPATGVKYSIEAKVAVTCDHVIFYNNGASYHQENTAPWSIFGDSGGVLTTGKLGSGTHVVRADAYLKTTIIGTATTTVIEP